VIAHWVIRALRNLAERPESEQAPLQIDSAARIMIVAFAMTAPFTTAFFRLLARGGFRVADATFTLRVRPRLDPERWEISGSGC